MSKSLKSTYVGYPDTDQYGEVLVTKDTAQFIVDMLAQRYTCALRLFVGSGTTYQIVFSNLHAARTYRKPAKLVVDTNPPIKKSCYIKETLSWDGGGDVYLGIERKFGFAFLLSGHVYPEYVKEKLNESCQEIAENIANLLNMMYHLQPTEYAKNI